MTELTKRTTVYLEAELHRALRLKAAITDRSMSALINEFLRERLAEDADDLQVLRDRAGESVLTYEEMLEDLRARGKL